MKVDECFELGYIIKPHGLNGNVNIFLDTDFPEDYKDLESVFVLVDQKLVPFFIQSIEIRGTQGLVSFEEVNSVDHAKTLKGCTLHLPESYLPELKGKDFYFHEVIGFEVRSEKAGVIGKVVGYYDHSSQGLLAVDYEGKEVLIPADKQIIKNLNRKNKFIDVQLPEGLLDIYLK